MHTLPYKHPAVRDLAWSLGSPPLLMRNDSAAHWPDPDWYEDILAGFHTHLLELDRSPGALLKQLARRHDRRLGACFERLWHYWLTHNPRYRLLAANLPVRAAGRTLGEFDLIVEDRDTGRTQHWEIALKFYLGQGDTADAANWWGPARRDRLDIKTRHLLHHQSRLSGLPQAQALLSARGLHIDETRVILKGRLFYPAGARLPGPSGCIDRHPRGGWLHAGQLERQPAGHWLVLEKQQWLAPLLKPSDTLLSTPALAEWWHGDTPRRPVCVASFTDGRETGRWFIVPDDWGAGSDAQSL